jgi:hypothetical protein
MSSTTDRPAVDITVIGQCEGFTVEISLSLPIAQLREACRRLQAAGVQPLPLAASAPSTNGKPKGPAAPKVQPYYNDQGDPCCPVHSRPLKEGTYGLYCSARAEGEAANEKGYCKLRFLDA